VGTAIETHAGSDDALASAETLDVNALESSWEAPLAAPSRIIALSSGRSLEVGPSEQISVRAPDGSIELSIELGPNGPIVRVHAARLEVSAKERVRFSAPSVELAASEHLSLRSGGDLDLAAAGDAHLETEGEVHVLGTMIHLN
jgi:hypothetical protein